MPPFVARPSLWRLVLLLLAALGFVVAGAWFVGLLGSDPPPGAAWIGWISMAFFGPCAAVILKRLFDRDDQVRISTQGIMSKHWSPDTIPWSEITDITVWEMQRQQSIILHLKDPSRFPSTGVLGMLAGANRVMTGGDVPVQLVGTDHSVEEALVAIRHFRSAAQPMR